MVSMTKLRPDPPAVAEDDFPTIDRRRSDMLEGIRKREVALALARNPGDAESDRGEWARTFAADFVETARRRPERLESEIRDHHEELENLRPFWEAARERHDQTLARQSTAVAVSLQPRQKAIVRKISAALEQLSASIGDARELHKEFERRSPKPSPFWPDITAELIRFGVLGDHTSAGSRWAQRMRSIGLLPR